jgi:hypothetical protein
VEFHVIDIQGNMYHFVSYDGEFYMNIWLERIE